MSKSCDVCKLYLWSEYALQSHLAGKKHLRKVQLYKRSIVVSPLPRFITPYQLLLFFQQYGRINWYQFGGGHLIIEFNEKSSAETLLSKPIYINDFGLKIRTREAFEGLKPNDSDDNADIINFNNMEHIFKDNTTFDEQLEMFLNAIQLTDAEIKARYDPACLHLDKIFKTVFPKCKAYKFGSTQTGLSFKECDLDIYVDIGEPIYETKVTPNSWTMKEIFREAKRLMYGTNYIFSDIVTIPKAKVPIIKFHYFITKVSCDVSFKNSSGIQKSRLIKYYMSLDNRVRPLIMLIKYWARNLKISGCGKITNYALVLLVIFFLQQPSVNILPPLAELQKDCKPQIENGLQVNFNENAILPPITNTNSIPQLLHCFFFYYSTFQFQSTVICPIDGMIHTQSEFEDTENLPQCMDMYKACVKINENLKFSVNKPMCVQDPIELTHNVTTGINFHTLNFFIMCCTVGARICVESTENDYKGLLKTLCTRKVTKFSENQFKISIPVKWSASKTNSIKTSTSTTRTETLTEDNWFSVVSNIIIDIFERVFKIQVETVTNNGIVKQQKINISSDIHKEKQCKIILHCTGSHRVWCNRKVHGIILDPSLNCLEKEAFISEKVVKNYDTKICDMSKIDLRLICIIEKKFPSTVSVTVINQSSNNSSFNEFERFAISKLSSITTQTLTFMTKKKK